MTPIELLLSKLPNAKRNGKGWMARCPAHDDERPSLSISEGDGGRALVHCHAGCAPKAIVGALGLKLADLMPANATATRRKSGKPHPSASGTFSTSAEAVAALERQRGPHAAAWTYHNAAAEPVGVIIRWNLAKGGKDVRPVSRIAGAKDGWRIGAMPSPRPLYRLPELMARPDEVVYVVEGEKCADAMAALGLLATTSAGGANAADKSDWTPLAGREVVIIPDADVAGEKYAADVQAALRKQTPPPRVRVVRLRDGWADLAAGGDIADVVEAWEDPDAIRAKLAALTDGAELQTPASAAPVLEPFRPFPTHVLPEPMRRFVKELAAATGNDPACAALAALVTLAGTVGNRVAARVKRGWVEPSILWGAIVGRSGTTKSAVLKLAVQPLVDWYKEARQRYADERAAYQSELEHYEVQLEQWKKAQKNGTSRTDPPAKPEPPTENRLLVSDVTCEKLGVLLQENPLGLLLIRDELAAWIGAFDRYSSGGKGSDAPTWLSFFDGASVVIDRKSAAGTIFVEKGSVSVLGGIQPGTLRRLFGAAERESGLLARLLPVAPPTKPAIWTEAELSEATAARWANLVRAVMEIQPEVDDHGAPRPLLVPLTEDAKAIYIAWHNAHGLDTAEIHADDLAAHFAKLRGICIRIALLLTCVDAVTSGGPVAAIGLDQMQRAIVIADWFKGEARRVYNVLSEDEVDREQQSLVTLISQKGGSINGRELSQSRRTYRKVEAANAALQDLVESGYGTWETPVQSGPGGPKSPRFVLASAYIVNVYSNPTDGSADGNPVDVDAPETDGDWGEVA